MAEKPQEPGFQFGGGPPILQTCKLRAGHREPSDLIPDRAAVNLAPRTPLQEAAPTPLGCCTLTHFLLPQGRCLDCQEDRWPWGSGCGRSGFES